MRLFPSEQALNDQDTTEAELNVRAHREDEQDTGENSQDGYESVFFHGYCLVNILVSNYFESLSSTISAMLLWRRSASEASFAWRSGVT